MRSPSAIRLAATALPLAWSVLFLTALTHAQTYNVLHSFTGGADGAIPEAGVAQDAAGNLYGTTSTGGAGYGTAFRLQYKNSAWIFSPLYSFEPFVSGIYPSTVVIGPNGTVYGLTRNGTGYPYNDGTVFNLRPPPRPPVSFLSAWNETVVHQFQGMSDGELPTGNITFDPAGNLYGTTGDGGLYAAGSVYVLTPSDGGWTLTNIYSFLSMNDGASPNGGVIIDGSGNLYGTTAWGGDYNAGTVFELVNSGNGWMEKILYNFQDGSDGERPTSKLVLDGAGNLYGTTTYGGLNNTGTVFELCPSGNGNWNFSLVYSFGVQSGGLVVDGAGNLYGETAQGGNYGYGSIFELVRNGDGWTEIDLHDFTNADGTQPSGYLLLGANGNLYGTTLSGGAYDYGVVWQLIPSVNEGKHGRWRILSSIDKSYN